MRKDFDLTHLAFVRNWKANKLSEAQYELDKAKEIFNEANKEYNLALAAYLVENPV